MKKYVSIKDIVNDEKYPFSMGQLRAFVTNRHKNGLATSIRKIGRRIYIREDLFDQWVDSHFETINDNIKLEDLEFSIRVINGFKVANITSLNKLLETSKYELSAIPHMGKRSIEEIEDKLVAYGYHLKED